MRDTPRRWFQIHLSTAVVLMFVAGGLVWANVVERRIHEDWENWAEDQGWGWPTIVRERSYRPGPDTELLENGRPINLIEDRSWSLLNGCLNLASASIILAAVAFICEWLLNRRERRAP